MKTAKHRSFDTGRRRMLTTTIGTFAGVFLLSACEADKSAANNATSGACSLTPEQEEGPFYVDEGLLRSDVLDGQTGVPLQLEIKVVKAGSCAPIANAAVEIWSANQAGKYSDKGQEGTVGQKYLRGVQISDAAGVVRFKTIYPGWYSGRTCHIHLKVRTGGTASGTTYASTSSTEVHGGQIFFPAETNASLRAVYTDDKNRFINNADDRIYNDQGGSLALLSLTGSLQAGFAGSITVDVK